MEELTKGFQFGTPDSHNIIGFTLRFLLLAVPGTVLGHLIDEMVLLAQQRWRLSSVVCLAAQTAIWVLFFLVLYNFAPRYASEFQNTYAGLVFVTLFFTVQSNYVDNLQRVISIADRSQPVKI
jgi:hypothetical protein